MTQANGAGAPDHEMQRTAPCVTAAASTAAFPPAMQVLRPLRLSLSLGSLGLLRAHRMKATSHFLICIIATFIISLVLSPDSNGQAAPTPRIERIETEKLKPGPVRHATLTPQQIERLRKLQAALAEVDYSPLEKWIDDFRHDADPDREISVFEAIAQAYQAFCSARPRTLPQKQDVIGLLLERSGTTDEDVLAHRKLKVLTTEQAREALSYYKKAAIPIQVIQK
ncbi:MAG: hypothetical protein QOD99_2506 [Chthoniobacter sp.]|nr:hypothetical protein [Chthoniobacter sp.]